MKKALAIAVVFASAIMVLAPPMPVTVLNTMTELLAKRATHGETIIVLGVNAPFDSQIRVAKHFTNIVFPINNITAYDAVGGGEWYVTPVGTVTGGGPAGEVTLACSDDGTTHSVTVDLYSGVYTLFVDQSPSLAFPTSLYLESQDGTSHKVAISKNVDSGVYSVSVASGNSVIVPQMLALIAPDTSEHTIRILTNGPVHVIGVTQ